jgi:oxygen-dependent protoporphyrinogen oxidase
MDQNKFRITILGAGISGLATAYWLVKAGWDVVVMEADREAGGSMISRQENGFLVDYGANSGLETTPLIRQLVAELGLSDRIVYADEAGSKRYILKSGRLSALPTNPLAFVKTDLFSGKAKLRLLMEPFIGRSEEGYYQSISQFVRRRLGQEFLDYAINPFVAGVYAGNPDDLSVKSAFPKLYRLEEVYGGLVKGLIKGAKERKKRSETSKQSARMFSFRGGMQEFSKALAAKLGEKIRFNCEVHQVLKDRQTYKVLYRVDGRAEEIESELVVSAIPAYSAASVFAAMDEELCRHLKEIYYPPVKVLFLGYPKTAVGQTLDGFGFLIPEKEDKKFLGAIWNSTIFPGRSNAETAAFTLFIGGARSPELFREEPAALKEEVIAQFQEIMEIGSAPVFVKERMWPQAIPQYTLGYIKHEEYFEKFEQDHPGIFLSGNYRGGISVGDCIINSDIRYLNIKRYIKKSFQGRF